MCAAEINLLFKHWDLGMKNPKARDVYLKQIWWNGIYARDVAGDSGESKALSRGDDTVEICAVTVAPILPIISAIYY
jgi:hypothetical protein